MPERAAIAETLVSRVLVPPTIMASILDARSVQQILLGCTHSQQRIWLNPPRWESITLPADRGHPSHTAVVTIMQKRTF
jgi:hypothetical protein